MSTDQNGPTMATDHRRVDAQLAQEILLDDPAFLRKIAKRMVQQILEAEVTEHIGAASYERSTTRTGHKPRTLRTGVGTLNLSVPQGKEGTLSTRLFSATRGTRRRSGWRSWRCRWRESQPGRSRK